MNIGDGSQKALLVIFFHKLVPVTEKWKRWENQEDIYFRSVILVPANNLETAKGAALALERMVPMCGSQSKAKVGDSLTLEFSDTSILGHSAKTRVEATVNDCTMKYSETMITYGRENRKRFSLNLRAATSMGGTTRILGSYPWQISLSFNYPQPGSYEAIFSLHDVNERNTLSHRSISFPVNNYESAISVGETVAEWVVRCGGLTESIP